MNKTYTFQQIMNENPVQDKQYFKEFILVPAQRGVKHSEHFTIIIAMQLFDNHSDHSLLDLPQGNLLKLIDPKSVTMDMPESVYSS